MIFISLQFANAQIISQTFNSTSTFTAPIGVTTVTFETFGGGRKGGSRVSGGNGAYGGGALRTSNSPTYGNGRVILTYAMPEINITRNAVSMIDGDTTPFLSDDSDFGSTNVGVGLSKTFTIYNTSSSGLRTADISIVNNDTDENPYNYSIQGTAGQSIAAFEIENQNQKQIELPRNNINTGTYIIKMATEKSDISTKIVFN